MNWYRLLIWKKVFRVLSGHRWYGVILGFLSGTVAKTVVYCDLERGFRTAPGVYSRRTAGTIVIIIPGECDFQIKTHTPSLTPYGFTMCWAISSSFVSGAAKQSFFLSPTISPLPPFKSTVVRLMAVMSLKTTEVYAKTTPRRCLFRHKAHTFL